MFFRYGITPTPNNSYSVVSKGMGIPAEVLHAF